MNIVKINRSPLSLHCFRTSRNSLALRILLQVAYCWKTHSLIILLGALCRSNRGCASSKMYLPHQFQKHNSRPFSFSPILLLSFKDQTTKCRKGDLDQVSILVVECLKFGQSFTIEDSILHAYKLFFIIPMRIRALCWIHQKIASIILNCIFFYLR
jgi:hypothetical protein